MTSPTPIAPVGPLMAGRALPAATFVPSAGALAAPVVTPTPAPTPPASAGAGGGGGSPAPVTGALTAALAAGAASASTPAASGGGKTGAASKGAAPGGQPPVVQPLRARAPLSVVIESIPTAIWAALAGLGALAAFLAATALVATARSRRRERTIAAIEGMATTDSLTGVLNRGAFEERLQGELARARRYGRPLGVLTFDVEGLKAVNDAHGHSAGDQVLRSVAGVLTQSIRDHDVCGRMGGDEYAVLVTEQSRAGTERVLQRIAAQTPASRDGLGLRTAWGLSAGIATFPRDGESVRDLLDAADRRLYLSRGIRIEPVA